MNDDSKEFHNMLARDERRFKEADKDADGKLTFEEFTAFVHPEEYKHMEEVVVLVGVCVALTHSQIIVLEASSLFLNLYKITILYKLQT